MTNPAAASNLALANEPADGTPTPIQSKDYLSVLDLSPAELRKVLEVAGRMKSERAAGRLGTQPLAGRHVALLFEKPSLRTRSTLLIGVRELGGEVIEPTPEVTFRGRESIEDVARNLERWVTGAVMRTFEQSGVVRFAAAGTQLNVVNALTDEEHPCQALADMMTLSEHLGDLEGRTIAYVGDGNNTAVSLAQAGAMLGINVKVASPAGFELSAGVVSAAQAAAHAGATVSTTNDAVEAVEGADAVYTDAWASMGQEDEATTRASIFQPYQVNEELMKAAGPQALFMHCLPAHRGSEVTDAVIDASSSVVFDQAENRLHTQKALLALLMR